MLPFECRVLDLSQERSGPYCTRLLAAMGADVVKIEPRRTGDPIRHNAPFVDDIAGPERSLAFHWLNGAKKSVTLDLATPAGRDLALALAQRADVVVENFPPGELERLGLSVGTLQRDHRGLVVTSISNFGQDGPNRDYRGGEAVLYAMSGGMQSTGDGDKAPLLGGPQVAQYTAALHAYIGTLMALYRVHEGGAGDHVDVSVQESALENVEIHLAEFAQDGKVARRNGDTHPLVPWQCHPCRDGYAAVIGGPLRHWPKAAEIFEEPRLTAPDLIHVGDRIKRRAEVESLLRPWLARHDKVDIYHRGQAAGFAFGFLATLDDARQSPQHRAREFFRPTEPHPVVGTLSACGPLFRLSGFDWRMGRAPLLGEHTRDVLGDWLAMPAAEIDRLAAAGVV